MTPSPRSPDEPAAGTPAVPPRKGKPAADAPDPAAVGRESAELGNADSRPARARRQISWPAVGGISAVAGVLVAALIGVAQLKAQPHDPDAVPADRQLELVDIEFADRPIRVTVLQYISDGEPALVSPYPEQSAGSGDEAALHDFVQGPAPQDLTPQAMRRCARERQDLLAEFTGSTNSGGGRVHPGIRSLSAAYGKLGG